MTSNGILLSGGIDSVALAFWKRPKYAFTVNYGQTGFLGELRASQKICSELGINHEVVSVDCRALGAGDMAGLPAAKNAPAVEWWPFRNQLLVTLVAMKGYPLGLSELLVGSVLSDGFHSDGTEAFYTKLDSLLSFQEGGVRVSAPAIGHTSVELVRLSGIPLELLAWTHSCHVSEFACGQCRGCHKNQRVWEDLQSGQ
ncbi:7-cyano-7-deazaguanine synthase [Prosthecobacter debontii]|uniref:7-cyano-7-deazaguanine synthase n=1 Tax=Prosthecobacter debontii TaxID=48467 RepID=A0A1T4Z2U0_9BACT|nr:7-cyano-7-deazaguanine synthase [Prosthecobacter debontii]